MIFASYPEPDCWPIRQGSPEIHAEKTADVTPLSAHFVAVHSGTGGLRISFLSCQTAEALAPGGDSCHMLPVPIPGEASVLPVAPSAIAQA
jgi:hypothetical protein